MNFITLEGGDGAGKTTQIKLLADKLHQQQISVLQTREPGGCPQAEAIRDLLVTGSQDKWDSLTEVLLLYAARREHMVRSIMPALAKGQWVISDRFADSTYAYQGYGMGIDHALIDQIHKAVVGDFKPALTFVLDINPANAVQRSKGFLSGENRYESMNLSFHDKLRAGFLQIAKDNPDRCVVIDAANDVDAVHEQIWQNVQKRFLNGTANPSPAGRG